MSGLKSRWARALAFGSAVALCGLMAVAHPGPAAAADLSSTLSGIELHYNRLATLRVDFQQTVHYLGRAPMVEGGTLFLRRPGQMRWDYSTPAGKLLVGDGDLLHYYNPLSNQVRQLRPSQTGDLRVPLAFLLGRLNFRRQFRDLQVAESGGTAVLSGNSRTGREAYSRVEFTFDPATYTLLHLKVFGLDESLTSFDFSGEVVNPRLEDALFDFKAPPGAEVVDQTNPGN